MVRIEPRFAHDYDDRSTVAVKSVLVEIGQILGSFEGKFVVIGGAVPWLLPSESDMSHGGVSRLTRGELHLGRRVRRRRGAVAGDLRGGVMRVFSNARIMLFDY